MTMSTSAAMAFLYASSPQKVFSGSTLNLLAASFALVSNASATATILVRSQAVQDCFLRHHCRVRRSQ